MADSLLSLGIGTMKHVVPWKSRREFLSVYEDLYSEDDSCQVRAVNRIAMWRSRVGSKLSVAIDSSAGLLQARRDYDVAKRDGTLVKLDAQLRSSHSLAIIRFVNHITEKAQTKAVAQPVHLVAREFGIPEWIVRLRHDATHASLPCLDMLVEGVRWALGYLKENFWVQQVTEAGQEPDTTTPALQKLPRMVNIREAMYDFQKARYQEMNADSKEEEEEGRQSHARTLRTLQKYLSGNRLRFLRCFLEDGILISTEEQLAVFGVRTEDFLAQSAPMIPLEMMDFWRPLLRKIAASGSLPLLLHIAMFSVTSEENLRNYQLVAWIACLLSQSLGPSRKSSRRRSKRKHGNFGPSTLPRKTLLAACLQNVNKHTTYLLKYVLDEKSVGPEVHGKLVKLLHIHCRATCQDGSSGDSDSDTVYTVEDVKKAKFSSSERLSPRIVEDIELSVEQSEVPWSVCTDPVDWAGVPIGMIPSLTEDQWEDDEKEDDDDDEEEDQSGSKKPCMRSDGSSDGDCDPYSQGRSKSARSSQSSDDSVGEPRSKRCKYIVTDELL